MSLRDLHTTYQNRVQFLVIYIREAHPADGWGTGGKYGIHDPKSIEERRQVAKFCATQLQYGVTTLVDEMDDAVMNAYASWPTRLYLVDAEGKISYAGDQGPSGFKPAELKDAIDALLDRNRKP